MNTPPEVGQLWRDRKGGARIRGIVHVPRYEYVAVMQRTGGTLRASHNPFLLALSTLQQGAYGWTFVEHGNE
jgi:hypothetical protein